MDFPRVDLLASTEAAIVREAYLRAFVDTGREWFQEQIGQRKQFSDGLHYSGYLWECFVQFTRIAWQEFTEQLLSHDSVYVLADDHSRDLHPGGTLWPFPPYSVIRLPAAQLLQLLPALPWDLYICDASMSWTLVLTHEYDAHARCIVSCKN